MKNKRQRRDNVSGKPDLLFAEVARLATHIRDLQDQYGSFACQMGFTDLCCLIGCVQLSLRHPGNNGEAARRARKVIENIIAALESASPGIGRLLNDGFVDAEQGGGK